MHAQLRRVLPLTPVILVVVGWFALLGPAPLGGPATYVVVSGTSMEPTLSDGDLVIARRADTYRPGDIVVFRVPAGEPAAGGLVIHRIVGGSGAGYVLQGDNKRAPDPWRPSAEDVTGALWLRLPGAAVVLTTLRQPALFAAVAAALAAFAVMLGGVGASERPAGRVAPVPIGGVGPDRYRWTRERGLAVCGGPRTLVDPTALRASAWRSAQASAAPYRWTVARAQAVCRTGGAPAVARVALGGST